MVAPPARAANGGRTKALRPCTRSVYPVPVRRRSLPLVAVLSASAIVPGCFLDRAALDPDRPDAQPPSLDAAAGDAGHDARVPPPDTGPPRDSGPCVPTSPPLDICDGRDNDCNPATPDGVDDAARGRPCDDDDEDLCADGVLACVGGALVCSGEDGVDDADLCNGVDDDCDPATADGSAEPTLSDPCDGGDADLCDEGEVVCTSGALACSDTSGDTAETCNRVDDDCDGAVDEEVASCVCRWATFGGHGYLFCNETAPWSDARSRCPAGFDLVIVTSREEHDFVQSTAASINNGNFWLGATRTMPPSPDGTQLTWVDMTRVPLPTDTSGFSNWRGGRPDGGDCLDMDPDQPSADGVNGRWDDNTCATGQRYVCESLR